MNIGVKNLSNHGIKSTTQDVEAATELEST